VCAQAAPERTGGWVIVKSVLFPGSVRVFSPVLAVLLVPPVHPVPRGKDIKCLSSSSTIPEQTVSLLKKGDHVCEE